jgi:hypothetical protein
MGRLRSVAALLLLLVTWDSWARGAQPRTTVPPGVILVKGAWSSASGVAAPLPEGGSIANNVYANAYFGISYPLPADWFQKFEGPPPSDGGRYVLAQLTPADTYKGPTRGNILITAQDMFFTALPAANALELVTYAKEHLPVEYRVEKAPAQNEIAGRSFALLSYWSPCGGSALVCSRHGNPVPHDRTGADQP